MAVDFTVDTYRRLLKALQSQGFLFRTVKQFIASPLGKGIILRHDVDRLPSNALTIARLEHERGIGATYYFRTLRESWDESAIKEIESLGHEVGYHYESLTTCKGNVEQAFDDFKRNLEKLRKLVPVSTICMHGSPRSRWDSRDMWKVYDYRSLGIVCEPYLDLDFDEVFYLTDTGRRWDGDRVSVRDRVYWGEGKRVRRLEGEKALMKEGERAGGSEDQRAKDKNSLAQRRKGGKIEAQSEKVKVERSQRFHSTFDIIEAAEKGLLPDKIMINTHPQRWNDKFGPWVKELVWQNVKNVIKRAMLAYWHTGMLG